MPIYQYTATDQTGAQSQGTFEAPDEQQAQQQLAQYGLQVSQLVSMDGPSATESSASTDSESPNKAVTPKYKSAK